jgi:hypothetical protein
MKMENLFIKSDDHDKRVPSSRGVGFDWASR